MKKIKPTEMSALAQLSYSEGLRIDIREKIIESLNGDAKEIAKLIVYGDNSNALETYRLCALQLKDWAKQLKNSKNKETK